MNKILLALLAGCLLLTAFKASEINDGSPSPLKGKRVLVFTKNGKGYVHQNIGAASACIIRLGRKAGFETDTSHDATVFSEANLRRYQVIVFNNTNNDVFDSDDQKLALMHFVEAGGGVVGLHSASGTERNWPWFKRMLGATFMRHPKHQPFQDIVLDPAHPSTSFLPKTWPQDDECYYVKEINPDLHVLVVHDLRTVSDSAKPEGYGVSFPSVWCHAFDGGRQWYTSLGHDSETYSKPAFEQHILGGLEWVAGQKGALNYRLAHATTPNDALPY